MQSFNTCSALAILIEDASLNTHIDFIRRNSDKAFNRWMPHINLLFPFLPVEELLVAEEMLNKELEKVQSFEMNLQSISSFSQKGIHTVHLSPSEEDSEKLHNLYLAVRRALPHFQPQRSSFQGHLTIGQWKACDIPHELLAGHFSSGIRVPVSRVCILTRPRDGPFSVLSSIPLSTTLSHNPSDLEPKAIRGGGSKVQVLRPCFAFFGGGCTRAHCKFSHELAPKPDVCFAWQKGNCERGSSCRFSHDA